jgi:hypothetical protein
MDTKVEPAGIPRGAGDSAWPWKASAAGAVGGLVMGSYLMAAMGVLGKGFFTPLNLVAAAFPPFRPVLSGFQPKAALLGLALHLLMSAAWGLVLGGIARRVFPNLFRGAWSQVAVGLALGFLAWAVTGLRLGPAVDPVLDAVPAVHAFVAHLAYGLATATVLWAWSGSPRPFPAAAEARGVTSEIPLPGAGADPAGGLRAS